jgi:hypothetical protein
LQELWLEIPLLPGAIHLVEMVQVLEMEAQIMVEITMDDEMPEAKDEMDDNEEVDKVEEELLEVKIFYLKYIIPSLDPKGHSILVP